MIVNIVKQKMPSFLRNAEIRHSWVKDQLSRLDEGLSILDAGAGECRYKEHCKHLKYTSQDFGQYDGVGDGTALQSGSWDNTKLDIVSDITSIPVPDSSFDAILCTEVLEHLPYPDRAIKEFSRILKKGGKLILTSPFNSITHMAPYHFCTGFSKYWYDQVSADNGLEIESYVQNGNYFDTVLQELMRIPIMLKSHTSLGIFSYSLYLAILPLAGLIYLLSKLSNNSEYYSTFGYMLTIKKG